MLRASLWCVTAFRSKNDANENDTGNMHESSEDRCTTSSLLLFSLDLIDTQVYEP